MTGPKLPLAVVPAPSPTQFGSRRRGVVVLVLIAVLLGLAAFFTAAAQSEQAGTVTFVTPEGQRIPVALDSVEPDVKDATYTVRSARGAVTTVSVPQGWSLDTLASKGLAAASLDLGPYKYVQVDRTADSSGERVLLRKEQLTKSTAFPDGAKVVVFVGEDGLVHFLRPQTGSKDANGVDEIVLPATLTVRLLKRSPLKVTAVASPSTTKVGRLVKLTGRVDAGQAAGEKLTFTWSSGTLFNDTGETTSYRFRKRGNYPVLLQVTSEFTGVNGASDVVRVQVGPTSRTKGPDRTGGGTNTTGGADGGAADGLSGSGVSLSDYAGADPYADSASTSFSDGSVTDPAPVTPEPTPTTPSDPAPATTTPKETVPAPAGTTPVQGQLVTNLSLAAATVPAADASPAADSTATPVAARTGTPQTTPKEDGGLHVPAGVWMLLAIVLLLIGGFWQDAYRAVAPRSVPRIP